MHGQQNVKKKKTYLVLSALYLCHESW